MARRLILDTGVLIVSDRNALPVAGLAEDDDIVIAAITVSELRAGVELATKHHRDARASFMDAALQVLPVEPYDTATARVHARLLAHLHRTGRPRGAHDLIIAATAVATARTVVTTDRVAHFADLPGVTYIPV